MPHEATIDRYCEAWTDPDPDKRADLLVGVWAPGATYTDPMVHAEGAEALLAHITGIHQQMPGARIARTSEVQVHHDVARFAWQFTLPDGSSLPEGLDLAIFDSPGKIKRIVGFFGPLGSRLVIGPYDAAIASGKKSGSSQYTHANNDQPSEPHGKLQRLTLDQIFQLENVGPGGKLWHDFFTDRFRQGIRLFRRHSSRSQVLGKTKRIISHRH